MEPRRFDKRSDRPQLGESEGDARAIVVEPFRRLRPQAGSEDTLRVELALKLDPAGLDGIISMHLIESDAGLSGPTAELPAAAGASDWFVLVDGTSVSTVSTVLASRFTGSAAPAGAMQISSGIYELMWDLAKSDITPA